MSLIVADKYVHDYGTVYMTPLSPSRFLVRIERPFATDFDEPEWETVYDGPSQEDADAAVQAAIRQVN